MLADEGVPFPVWAWIFFFFSFLTLPPPPLKEIDVDPDPLLVSGDSFEDVAVIVGGDVDEGEDVAVAWRAGLTSAFVFIFVCLSAAAAAAGVDVDVAIVLVPAMRGWGFIFSEVVEAVEVEVEVAERIGFIEMSGRVGSAGILEDWIISRPIRISRIPFPILPLTPSFDGRPTRLGTGINRRDVRPGQNGDIEIESDIGWSPRIGCHRFGIGRTGLSFCH